MRPLTEQIDEFFEDLFSGSVITIFHEKADYSAKIPIPASFFIFADEKSKSLSDLMTQFGQLTRKYIESSPDVRKSIASELFLAITGLRFMGLIQNNPNNLKELDFQRDRAKTFAGDIKEQDEQIATLMGAVKKLQAELAGKGTIQ